MNVALSNSETTDTNNPTSLTNIFGFPVLALRISKLKEHFVVTCEQGNGTTGGPVLQVSSKKSGMSEIVDRIVLAFDDAGKLDAAWLTFTAEAYGDLERQLSSVLAPSSNGHSPFNGKQAIFHNDDGEVRVSNALFSDETTLIFMTQKFIEIKESRQNAAIA